MTYLLEPALWPTLLRAHRARAQHRSRPDTRQTSLSHSVRDNNNTGFDCAGSGHI